jgi:hypothetical protein
MLPRRFWLAVDWLVDEALPWSLVAVIALAWVAAAVVGFLYEPWVGGLVIALGVPAWWALWSEWLPGA